MRTYRARLGVLVVFFLSLGIFDGGALLTVLAVGVAPLVATFLLLRTMVANGNLMIRSSFVQGGSLWLAANLLPLVATAIDVGVGPALVAGMKSALWMAVLLASMLTGAAASIRIGTNRLLGIGCAVVFLVCVGGLLQAPDGKFMACADGACLKPVLGQSVMLLESLESRDVIVHVPPAPPPVTQ